MDGYPTSYLSFKTRLARWTRGDWQIARWLCSKIKDKDGIKKKNPINLVSKYKILNNLVKSIYPITALIVIILLSLLNSLYNVKIWPVMLIAILSIVIPSVVEILNRVIYRKDGEVIQKTFYKSISGIKASIIRGVLEIGTLPDKAYSLFTSIVKSIYRMNISKKHMLEWITAEEAEKNLKTGLFSYYKSMLPNVILGLIYIILFTFNPLNLILGILWIVTPGVMNIISKKDKKVMQ